MDKKMKPAQNKSFVYILLGATHHLIPNLISDQRLDKGRMIKSLFSQQQFNHQN